MFVVVLEHKTLTNKMKYGEIGKICVKICGLDASQLDQSLDVVDDLVEVRSKTNKRSFKVSYFSLSLSAFSHPRESLVFSVLRIDIPSG